MEPKLHALGVIIPTMLGKHRIANAGQMRRLCQVIAPATSPDQNVVGPVTNRIPSLSFWTGESAAKSCDMLVVPCVAICDGSPLGDARDLIAVVPPRHDTRVLRRMLIDPFISLEVVIDDHRSTLMVCHKEKPKRPSTHVKLPSK